MLLRSGFAYGYIYEVEIDFDEASREWGKNKVSVGNGCYIYK
jgi:hypothetical protein